MKYLLKNISFSVLLSVVFFGAYNLGSYDEQFTRFEQTTTEVRWMLEEIETRGIPQEVTWHDYDSTVNYWSPEISWDSIETSICSFVVRGDTMIIFQTFDPQDLGWTEKEPVDTEIQKIGNSLIDAKTSR